MESSGHRANILTPEWTVVGIGIVHESPQPDVDGHAALYTTEFGVPPPPAAR